MRFATVVFFVLAPFVVAAPGPKEIPETIVGELDLTPINGPTVHVDTNTGRTTYWLVFPRFELERKAKILGEPGASGKVKVTGKLASGGQWKYLIVEAISEN